MYHGDIAQNRGHRRGDWTGVGGKEMMTSMSDLLRLQCLQCIKGSDN